MPDVMSCEACVCRNECSEMWGMPIFLIARLKSRLRLSGCRGLPSQIANTRPSGGALPRPSARRRSCCPRQWARNSETTAGDNDTVRLLLDDLGGLKRRPPRRVCSRRSFDAEDTTIEIDILPTQGDSFAAP